MEKIIYKRVHRLLLYSLAALMLISACKKEESSAPVITGIRNYAASPSDSAVQQILPGQWVVISGHNLKDAVQIFFDGQPASFNSALFSDSYAVVQLPAVIPFPSVSSDKINTIEYITTGGETTFTFSIVAPAPTITGVSNENAIEGDSVYIYGTNLFFINKITFAGAPITDFKLSDGGTSVGFILPKLTQSGKVVVEAQAGSDSTVYNVNDVTTGMLCNFDDVNTFSWGCGTSNNNPDFPGNRGWYAVLDPGEISAGDGAWWNGGRGINTNDVQWVPKDSLGVGLNEYAFKFEMNVSKPWKNISIYILKSYSWDYLARFEPWKDANGVIIPVQTNGWTTVTIPFSMFRKDNGTGLAITSLTDLLGSEGFGSVHIHTMNNSASATSFYGAIDNIRVVKIR